MTKIAQKKKKDKISGLAELTAAKIGLIHTTIQQSSVSKIFFKHVNTFIQQLISIKFMICGKDVYAFTKDFYFK